MRVLPSIVLATMLIYWLVQQTPLRVSTRQLAVPQGHHDRSSTGGLGTRNFPVLISITDANLVKALASGNDIVFTSSDGTAKRITNQSHERHGRARRVGADPKLVVEHRHRGLHVLRQLGASNQQNVTATWESNFKACGT